MVREYSIENGNEVDLEPLRIGFMEKDDYMFAHANLPIICHDAFINYQGGILLVKRKIVPAKEELWPIGGRIQRGVSTKKSLKDKVSAECGLEIYDIQEMETARHFWETDPFGHGKGTDTPCYVFYAVGVGNLKLDKLHDAPRIVKPENYNENFRRELHPYVRDFMDFSMVKLKNERY